MQARPESPAIAAAYHHRCRKFSECGALGVRRADDHDQYRHPERATDLPRGLVDGAADREALVVQARNRGGAQHRESETDPRPDGQGTRQPMPHVVGRTPIRIAYQTSPAANTREADESTGRKPSPASRPAGPETAATTSGPG